MTDKVFEWNPDLAALREVFQHAPPIASLYALDAGEDEAGPLRPKALLRRALQARAGCSAGVAHSPMENQMGEGIDDAGGTESWLPVLRELPDLWDSFEVPDVIVTTLKELHGAAFARALAYPVLDRAERLLHVVLEANGAAGTRFEWSWLENRPALHLLGERIAIDMDQPADGAQLARLEWLVQTLNPNDNQGFRDVLMRAYLENARVEDALALSSKYPDDFGPMRYNRALALFAASLEEAADATPRMRLAVEMLPSLDPGTAARNHPLRSTR